MEENTKSLAAALYLEHAKDEKENGYFYAPVSYQPIIDSLGKVILQKDDDGYQGDSRVLYKAGDRIGYLQFGWGSCSGCDALQACNSISDIDELINDLRDRIKWFSNPIEALDYFKTHDWEHDYSWHSDEQKEFIAQAIALLEPSK